MTKAHDDFRAAFDRFLDEVGIADAMTVATGMFVSLVVGYLKQKGEDTSKTITIEGFRQRDVTIHPPKPQEVRHEHSIQ